MPRTTILKRYPGVALLAALFGYYAVSCLLGALDILLDFVFSPPALDVWQGFRGTSIITGIIVVVILLALALYFGRIIVGLFRLEETKRIPAIISLIGVLIYCSTYLVLYYTHVVQFIPEATFDRTPPRFFAIVGVTIFGLIFLLSRGKELFAQINGESESEI